MAGVARRPSPRPSGAQRLSAGPSAVRRQSPGSSAARRQSPGPSTVRRPSSDPRGAGAAADVGCQVFVEVERLGGDDSAAPHPLRDITDLELEEIRQMKHPPETVSRVMECVHLLLGGEGPSRNSTEIDWINVLRTVVRTDFLRRVRHYELGELRGQPTLVDYICREYFSGARALRPDRVRRASRAVVAFFGWTVALIAGALPAWPVEEVGGAEARQHVFELEADRLKVWREAQEEEAARLEAARQEEAKREEQKEAERQRVEKEQAERREAEQQEAARQEEEKRREHEEKERQAAEEVARLAEQARLQAERAAEEEDEEEEEEEEEEEIFIPTMCMWDTSGNPERSFLEVDEGVVHFPSADFVSSCNVVTRDPVRRGTHFFEFALERLGGQQWCGVTTDSTQAGMRVSGMNLKGWSYCCGDRVRSSDAQPALHVNKKAVQPFDQVLEGDVVGVLLDADRRGLAFLRNGELQGVCELIPRNRAPLYLLTHMGAAGDRVELRRYAPERAPKPAREALEALLGNRQAVH